MLNFLAYALTYTISMNGSVVGTTTLNNIPTYQQCVETGTFVKQQMAANGIRVTFYCSKRG